jgi:hypothetical protein
MINSKCVFGDGLTYVAECYVCSLNEYISGKCYEVEANQVRRGTIEKDKKGDRFSNI